MRRAYKTAGRVCGANGGARIGALLKQVLINFGFWSLENDNDYYVSLEDDTPIYSLTEKE